MMRSPTLGHPVEIAPPSSARSKRNWTTAFYPLLAERLHFRFLSQEPKFFIRTSTACWLTPSPSFDFAR